jgi:hypothetical protein
VNLNIAYRWFLGLDIEDPVPNHSTFSKNRHGRFKESGLFQETFNEIVIQCIKIGLVDGKEVTVDGSLIKANASKDSMKPIIDLNYTPETFIEMLDKENMLNDPSFLKKTKVQQRKNTKTNANKFHKKEIKKDRPWESNKEIYSKPLLSNETHRSITDPDARLARKWFTKSQLCHQINYLMDNKSRIILGVKAESPDKSGEMDSAISLLRDLKFKFGIFPESLGADKGYFAGKFLDKLKKEKVTAYIPFFKVHNPKLKKNQFTIKDFKYDDENDEYICPENKRLHFSSYRKRNENKVFRAKVSDCQDCKNKAKCTSGKLRTLAVSVNNKVVEEAIKMCNTKEYRRAMYYRKQIEALFGEAKTQMGLNQAKFRKRWNVSEQFLLTATAQNIKRLIKGIKPKLKSKNVNKILNKIYNFFIINQIKIFLRLNFNF